MFWSWYTFDELPASLLYDLLALRSAVFVVEQQSIYQDLDGLDQRALHLICHDDTGAPVACLRLLPPGLKYPESSIGRVIVAAGKRGSGLGQELMRRGLEQADALYPGQGNRLSAQCYLIDFYRSFGYRPVGEPYDEDGIAHIEMERRTAEPAH